MSTVVYSEWSAASVLLPSGEQWHRVRAYATSRGLEIYRVAGKVSPDWSSPINFTLTERPRRGVLHVGIDIHTDDGVVVVTPTGGCWSCGSAMRGWVPPGLGTVQPWPQG